MQFKLNAEGAMAAGHGISNLMKAYATGPQVRQQAAQSQEAIVAKIYADNMQGNQYGANARKLTADATDQEMTTRLRDGVDAELVANPGMPAYERALRMGFKFAGPQHMQNWSAAGVNEKKIADLNAVQANPELAQATGTAYGAVKGELPFASVNDGGYSMNRYTGNAIEANPVLAKLYGEKRQSETAENRAQAGSASASAANSRASADLTTAKLKHFIETGRMPSASDGTAGGLNIGQIRDDIRADFNSIYPAISGTGMRPKSTPTFDDFTRQWLRQYNIPETEYYGTSRSPEQDKRPQKPVVGKESPRLKDAATATTQAQEPIPAPDRPKERKVDALYDTPKGLMRWSGSGWVPVK